jgi:hypothetical protein
MESKSSEKKSQFGLTDFKSSFTPYHGLEKRQKVTVSLRKKARDELVKKRRYNPSTAKNKFTEFKLNAQQLYAKFLDLDFNDYDNLFKYVQYLRHMITNDSDILYTYIEIGFLQILEKTILIENDNIKFETIWSILNLCSGASEYVQAVLDCNFLGPLIDSLQSNNKDIVESAVWALANIAGDSDDCKLLLLSNNILPNVMDLCSSQSSPKFVEQIVWLCQNLISKGVKEHLDESTYLELFIPVLGFLNDVLSDFAGDDNILIEVCHWVQTFTSTNPIFLPKIVDFDIMTSLKRIFPSIESREALQRCIMTFGSLCEHDSNELTDFVLCDEIMCKMYDLLSHKNSQIRKYICWVLSNIAAGTQFHINSLLTYNFIPSLINIFSIDQDFVKGEIVWIFSNMLTSSSNCDIMDLCLTEGFVPPLCSFLSESTNSTLIIHSLTILRILLTYCNVCPHLKNVPNICLEMVEECGGSDILERCERLEHKTIQKIAEDIILTFFDDSDNKEHIFVDEFACSEDDNFVNDVDYNPEMEFTF